MPELVLALVRIGIVVLLWFFVLAAVRVIRTDIYGSRAARPTRRPARDQRQPKQQKQQKQRRRDVPQALVVTQRQLAGTSIALREAPVTIGRANAATLVLADDYASNKHARSQPPTTTRQTSPRAWARERASGTSRTSAPPTAPTSTARRSPLRPRYRSA